MPRVYEFPSKFRWIYGNIDICVCVWILCVLCKIYYPQFFGDFSGVNLPIAFSFIDFFDFNGLSSSFFFLRWGWKENYALDFWKNCPWKNFNLPLTGFEIIFITHLKQKKKEKLNIICSNLYLSLTIYLNYKYILHNIQINSIKCHNN